LAQQERTWCAKAKETGELAKKKEAEEMSKKTLNEELAKTGEQLIKKN
jgi:hypothetical protein